jgi:hypothetical protein
MPAPIATDCEVINDNFSRETGRLTLPIARLGLYNDPYHRLVTKSAWPDFMGTIITNSVSQRTIPTGSGWVNVGASTQDSEGDQTNNACLPPVKRVGYAVDRFQAQLRHQALESEPICLEDIRTSAFPGDEIQNYVKNLGENVVREWTKRYDDDYFAAAEHKVVVAPGLPEGTSAFPGTEPTSPMTLGVLRQAYDHLYMDNAGDDGDAIADDGSPVFNVLASRSTIENIIKLNEDVRQDIRWSSRVNELLGPNGLTPPKFSYGGFVFHARPFTKRFNDNGSGGFVEVPEYITDPASKGTKAILNPAYLTAKYDSTAIFHPKAVEWLVPNPNLKVGNVVYGPQNYTGDYKWINEYDRVCNPDKNVGYWRAKMSCASKIQFPQWGYYFLHLRCDLANDLIACPVNLT